MKLAVLFLSLVTVTLAADVTGKWVAQVPGRNDQTMEMTFTLKAEGNSLSGEISSPRGSRPIEEGKISGQEISFSQTLEFNNNKFKFLYKGVVEGNQIKFTREREGGQGRKQEFVAKKVS
ncbi:MAG: hypothetical protein M1436_00485 [Acidobacteria bacterium]|nr:hypothetical protein [Acidobacteriota bacterium]